MSEFKVNIALLGEVSAFSKTGADINSSVSAVDLSAGISTLKAGTRFVNENNSIIDLMNLYQQLVIKDADDLLIMNNKVNLLDNYIAKNIR